MLETTAAFLYFLFTVNFNNSDWVAMYGNLRKLQWRWGMVAKVLKNIGATVQSWEMIYKVIVQTVLLYRIDSWLVTEALLKVVEGFQHQVAWRIKDISYL